MQFHEIDTLGKMWIQRLSSLPTWTSADRGRMIYNISNGYIYMGGSASWEALTTGGNDRYIDRTTNDTHAGTIRPTVDATYNLGHSSYRYANIYAVNFVGLSTTATYADIAEKYLLDKEYTVGTILKVNTNDNSEMCEIKNPWDLVSGIVSDKPGIVLNAESAGVPIALVGKTPVRVIGPVKKGDKISPFENGYGRVTLAKNDMIAISLENNNEESEKLITCLLKL